MSYVGGTTVRLLAQKCVHLQAACMQLANGSQVHVKRSHVPCEPLARVCKLACEWYCIRDEW